MSTMEDKERILRNKLSLLLSRSPGFREDGAKGIEVDHRKAEVLKFFNLLPDHHRKDVTVTVERDNQPVIMRSCQITESANDLLVNYGIKLVEEWTESQGFVRDERYAVTDDLGLTEAHKKACNEGDEDDD